MDRETSKLSDAAWVVQCAKRLRDHWPHADPTSLEEAAAGLWDDESLRALAPEDAAAAWLRRGMPGADPAGSGSF